MQRTKAQHYGSDLDRGLSMSSKRLQICQNKSKIVQIIHDDHSDSLLNKNGRCQLQFYGI